MKAAVIRYTGMKTYAILLPDHTVKDASVDMLLTFLLHFNTLDQNTAFRDGTGSWSEDDPMMRRVDQCAYITDNGELIVLDPEPFQKAFRSRQNAGSFVGLEDYAKLHGRTKETVKSLLQNGRIPGAKKIGKRGTWIIPKDAPYPEDQRTTGGGSYSKRKHSFP